MLNWRDQLKYLYNLTSKVSNTYTTTSQCFQINSPWLGIDFFF